MIELCKRAFCISKPGNAVFCSEKRAFFTLQSANGIVVSINDVVVCTNRIVVCINNIVVYNFLRRISIILLLRQEHFLWMWSFCFL